MAEKLSAKMGDTKIAGALLGFQKLIGGDTEVEDLDVRTDEIRQAVKAAGRAHQDAVENESAALYVALKKDGAADLVTKSFADAMYNACGRRRADPRFIAAFPKGQIDVTQPRLWDQLDMLDRYLPAWTDLAKKDTLVAEWLPKIRDARTILAAALDALKTAAEARNTARWNQLRARLGAVAIWDSNFGEIMSRFPGDRARVESYFPDISAARGRADEPDEENGAAPPAPAAPPGSPTP